MEVSTIMLRLWVIVAVAAVVVGVIKRLLFCYLYHV